MNKKSKSHWNNQFKLINIFIKKMTHNFEFSTGIVLFILEKQHALTFQIIKVELLTRIICEKHSSLAGLQREWKEMGSEDINNFSPLCWPWVKYSLYNYFKMRNVK